MAPSATRNTPLSIVQKRVAPKALPCEGTPFKKLDFQRSMRLMWFIATGSIVFKTACIGREATLGLTRSLRVCYKEREKNGTLINFECDTGAGRGIETKLDEAFAPPVIDAWKAKDWEIIVKKHLDPEQTTAVDKDMKSLFLRPANISHHAVMHIPDHHAKGNRALPKIPVVVWPLWEFGVGTAAAQHIDKNGIEESPLLELSDDMYNFDPNVVWIGDTGYSYGWSKWCAKFNEHVVTGKARRIELGLQTSWPIYIVDWTDYPDLRRCPDVEKTVGKEFVFYSKRSVAGNRRWDRRKGWVTEGDMINLVTVDGMTYRHTPLIVRTDTIELLQKSLAERELQLRDKIEMLDRPVDVTHVWPLNPSDTTAGVGDVKSKLRTKVSKIVVDLGNSTGLNVFVGLAGQAMRLGRRGVASAYVDVMLNTKILLVTQRDGWEDHYRLFEAMISGALVMTDRMIGLPAGLKNGISIIEFGSEEELRSLIDYYLRHTEERLAIAQEGRRISMMRHRSWHRIEEVIFGRALTTCIKRGDCPYIVHANETYQ